MGKEKYRDKLTIGTQEVLLMKKDAGTSDA